MSKEMPKWAQQFKELHAKYDEHKATDAMLKMSFEALSIACQALDAIRFGSLEANFDQCLQSDQEIAAHAMRRIEKLGK